MVRWVVGSILHGVDPLSYVDKTFLCVDRRSTLCVCVLFQAGDDNESRPQQEGAHGAGSLPGLEAHQERADRRGPAAPGEVRPRRAPHLGGPVLRGGHPDREPGLGGVPVRAADHAPAAGRRRQAVLQHPQAQRRAHRRVHGGHAGERGSRPAQAGRPAVHRHDGLRGRSPQPAQALRPQRAAHLRPARGQGLRDGRHRRHGGRPPHGRAGPRQGHDRSADRGRVAVRAQAAR